MNKRYLLGTKILTAIILCFVFASTSNANTKEKEAEAVKKIENYLNSMKSMQADFIQSATNNSFAEGVIYIQKPNRLNMQYSEDAGISIIGDGKYVIYHDIDLDQTTHISYKDIPATLILGNDIKIDGKKIKASNFYSDAGTTSVTFEYGKKENISPITLVFSNSPFELKQWSTKDPQGVTVTVSLYNVKKDIKLDKNLFKFKNKKLNPLNND